MHGVDSSGVAEVAFDYELGIGGRALYAPLEKRRYGDIEVNQQIFLATATDLFASVRSLVSDNSISAIGMRIGGV